MTGIFLRRPPMFNHVLRVDVLAGVQNAVLHPVDDGTGAQEEQRFEEGMGHQVENRRNVSADAQRRDHEAQLEMVE